MEERPFNPMNEPEQCKFCHDFPDWLEIWDDVFQCQNCYTTYDKHGNILEEGEPSEED